MTVGKGMAALCCGATLGLAACHSAKPVPTVNAIMTQTMEPSAEKIWNIASKAYNDVGDGLSASKLSADDWRAIGDASAAMKERAQILATEPHMVVAGANEPILGSQAVGVKGKIGAAWDAVDAKTVQARIDARPDYFRQKAQALVDAADAMHRASMTQDAALLHRVSSGLDETCDSCHEPFWGTDEPPPFPKDATEQHKAPGTGS